MAKWLMAMADGGAPFAIPSAISHGVRQFVAKQ
jgi:hypothetical protein